MQHATTDQLLDTALVDQAVWTSYYTFTFVRNPWDRAISDYFWLMRDQNIKGRFSDYLHARGPFEEVLNNQDIPQYRGDHLRPQTDYFTRTGERAIDFVGRFENFSSDIAHVLEQLRIDRSFETRVNKASKRKHYSRYFSDNMIADVASKYQEDIAELGYSFDDQRKWKDRFNFLR